MNGACIGWGHGFVALAPDDQRIGYVAAVYVDRSFRRHGIASELLERLTGWLRQQNVARIELITPARSSARALWLRRGFRPLMETLVLEDPSEE